MTPIPAGIGSVGGVAIALLGVAAYLVWLLPKLDAGVGAWCTGGLLAAGAAAAWYFAAPGFMLPMTGLAFGHFGRWLARDRNAPPAMRTAAPLAPASPALSRVAASAVPVAAPATEPPSTPALARANLGRYRIEREIGRGAMGAVYLGLDPQIGRKVAIKTMALGREFEGDELAQARERFFREAETAGRLQHPDIVTIFDAGEDQDLAYIAMQYLSGHDLQAHTAPGRLLPLPTVLGIAARVAEALAYAHQQGVVHRDIKPANVMIDLETQAVKVTDFGIARIADASRTRTGMVLGTPSFMSPEQMSGRRVDGRSDLYSLGVMLYQLLTGALPHQAESMARLMYQIANDPAPDVRRLRPELSEDLANVVALALEKRPEMRYADGHQLASDLRAVARAIGAAPATEPAAAAQAPVAGPAVMPIDDGGEFAKTVRFIRPEPGHNSRF